MMRVWLPVCAVIAAPIVVVGLVVWNEPPRAKPKFSGGQLVRTVVGGHVGQVIWLSCNERCWYDVRFNALQAHTDTRLLGPDGAVTFSPVAVVRNMREFELREVVK